MFITQGLHRAVQQHPDRIAVRFGNRQRTFRQIADRVARLAGALQKLGMQAGDRVAMLSLNSDRYLEYQMAVPWGGGVLNPCNNRWSAAEILYSLDDSNSTILLVATEPASDALRRGEDLAGIFYTGGTTGFPKGVMLSHTNMCSSGLALRAEGLATPGGTYLHAAPMFHLADMGLAMPHWIAGNTHSIIPAFNPELVLEVCKPGSEASAEALIAHCKTLIAGYKCPRSVAFADALPLSGAGKVLKTKLREPFWQGRERGVA